MHQWGPSAGGPEEVPARQPGGGQRRDQRQHQAPPHRGHRRGGRAVYNQVKSAVDVIQSDKEGGANLLESLLSVSSLSQCLN